MVCQQLLKHESRPHSVLRWHDNFTERCCLGLGWVNAGSISFHVHDEASHVVWTRPSLGIARGAPSRFVSKPGAKRCLPIVRRGANGPYEGKYEHVPQVSQSFPYSSSDGSAIPSSDGENQERAVNNLMSDCAKLLSHVSTGSLLSAPAEEEPRSCSFQSIVAGVFGAFRAAQELLYT